MKKHFAMALALLLALSVLTVSALAEEKDSGGAIGYISFLNLSEEQIMARREGERPAFIYLEEHGVLESAEQGIPRTHMIPYDTLDAMLMGLLSGEVREIEVPDCTARYLCAVNDRVKQVSPGKSRGILKESDQPAWQRLLLPAAGGEQRPAGSVRSGC